jgi:hypothetical protein
LRWDDVVDDDTRWKQPTLRDKKNKTVMAKKKD